MAGESCRRGDTWPRISHPVAGRRESRQPRRSSICAPNVQRRRRRPHDYNRIHDSRRPHTTGRNRIRGAECVAFVAHWQASRIEPRSDCGFNVWDASTRGGVAVIATLRALPAFVGDVWRMVLCDGWRYALDNARYLFRRGGVTDMWWESAAGAAWCERGGHRGYVWYNLCGFEPDYHCPRCGADQG